MAWGRERSRPISTYAPSKDNPYYTSVDRGQNVASDAMGNFAVTWQAYGPQDPNGLGVYVRLFDATGTPRTNDILVNQAGVGDQSEASIGMADSGDFVVVWHDSSRENVVLGRRFDAEGNPTGDEFIAYSDDNRNYARPIAVEMDGQGNFAVLLYAELRSDGPRGTTYKNQAYLVRRFNASGSPLGTAIVVSTNATARADMSMGGNGNFVVTGQGVDDVWAQWYGADGQKIGSLLVADAPANTNPKVDVSPDGNCFAMAWEGGEGGTIVARSGTTTGWLANAFVVEGGAIGIDNSGIITALSNGSPIVASRYTYDGSRIGSSFVVNTTPVSTNWASRWIDITSNGGLIATWYGFSATRPDYQGIAAQVYINADADNRSPIAESDAVFAVEDEPLLISASSLLSNDSDPDGDPLTLTSFTQAAHGAVTDLGGGILQYSPDVDFHGSDSFSYTISDGSGGTDTANVSVTITPVNDAPVAVNDSATTTPNQLVTINVLGNDFDIDGETLNLNSHTSPANGSVINLGGGLLQYTPNLGFTGDDSFNYTIRDPAGATDTGTVSIAVQTTSSMHVGDLDGSARWVNKTKWTATVVATVFDGSGEPVPNATVQGRWSNGVTSSATTNSAGQATFLSENVDKRINSVTFTVANISHASFEYDPGSNRDLDGDSNGTVITVLKPQALLAASMANGFTAAADLTDEVAQAAVSEALVLWSQQFVTSLPPDVDIQVADIPTGFLGWASGNTITLDVNADGAGWYTGLSAPVAGRVDLLTVVSHEIGHVLGYGHSDVAGDLMYETLTPGIRRLPGSAPMTMAAMPDSAIVSSLLLPERLDASLNDLVDHPLMANKVEPNAAVDSNVWILPLVAADYAAQPQRTSDTVRARIVKTIADKESELLDEELLDLLAASQQ